MRDFYSTYNYKRGVVMKTKIIKIIFALMITLASFNALADDCAGCEPGDKGCSGNPGEDNMSQELGE